MHVMLLLKFVESSPGPGISTRRNPRSSVIVSGTSGIRWVSSR